MSYRLNVYDPFSRVGSTNQLPPKPADVEKGGTYSVAKEEPPRLPIAAGPGFLSLHVVGGAQGLAKNEPLRHPIKSRNVVANSAAASAWQAQPPREQLRFPIKGQGVITLRVPKGGQALQITVSTRSAQPNSPTSVFLVLGIDSCDLRYGVSLENSVPFEWTKLKPEAACYLLPDREDIYWLSVDRPNGYIRFGRRYVSASMTVGEVQLKQRSPGGTNVWKVPESFSWLDGLEDISFSVMGVEEAQVDKDIQPNGLVADLPLYIVDGGKVTLHDLEVFAVTVPQNLSKECQYLYHNVAGPGITLDDPDFPFATAIQESVNTEGKLGWTMLQKKANEFGDSDITTTYLRITLGRNMGDSPGVPYVLEIWPAGHRSPIHDHGDSNAIIKVLHGSIFATYYDSLVNPTKIREAVFKKGDITWIDKKHYQVHRLENLEPAGGAVCVTIQCYRYAAEDTVHFEGFHYIPKGVEKLDPDELKKLDPFIPNSDMAYSDFYDAIKKEWNKAHPKSDSKA